MFKVALIAVILALTCSIASSFINAKCHTTYTGLCPGPDSCRCTLHEKCGSVPESEVKNRSRAMNSLGGCSGKCKTVTHDRCTGPDSCLLIGDECGSQPPSPPGPSPAPGRATIMARAESWVSSKIPYCQCSGGPPSECCGNCPYCTGEYHTRCDCSGYVSFCWGYKNGYTTRTLHEVSHPIEKKHLKRGDIMLNEAEHVVIFAGWTDSSKSHYVAFSEPGCHVSGPHYAFRSVVPYPFSWGGNLFKPYRKNTIGEDDNNNMNNNNNFDEMFASPAEIKEALKHSASYPFKHENEFFKIAADLQNHTLGLKLKYGLI